MRKHGIKEISEIILRGILLSGGIAVVATSPYFVSRILPKIFRYAEYKIRKMGEAKSFRRSFYYLRDRGMINIEYRGKQIYISLTKEGRKRLGKYNIDNLKIKKLKKWDKKWRVLIFDIQDKHKIKREALRGKIKELGLYQLQKSVWVYPYEFQKEIEILRNFFQLSNGEIKVIVADKIEKDSEMKEFFKIN